MRSHKLRAELFEARCVGLGTEKFGRSITHKKEKKKKDIEHNVFGQESYNDKICDETDDKGL